MKAITNKYSSYEDLVESFEVETLLMKDIGDYQGDYYFLLRDGDRYGYFIFGYGSCSGCDYLQSCYGDIGEITSYRDELWNSIAWKSRAEMYEYFLAKDEKLEWWGHSSDYVKFKEQVLELLKG